MRRGVLVVAALWAASGCTGGGTNDGGTDGGFSSGGGGALGGGGGATGTDLIGRRVLHRRLEGGELVTEDPLLAQLAVYARSGTTFTSLPVEFTDGGFVVRDAPAEYYVQLPRPGQRPWWIVSSARQLDLDEYNVLGRPGPSSSSSMSLRLTATGLAEAGWLSFQVTSPNTDFSGRLSGVGPATPSIDNVSHGLSRYTSGAAPAGTAGDLTHLWQMVSVDAGAGLILGWSVARSLELSGWTWALDDSTTLTAAFVTPPDRGNHAGTLRVSDYLADATAIGPGAEVWRASVDLLVTPSAPAAPDVRASVPGLIAAWTEFASADVTFNVPYVDPVPTWTHFVSSEVTFHVPTLLPRTNSGGVSVSHSDIWPLAQAPSTFSPRISPPTTLRIDGADAQRTGTFSSLTPTISWSAPTRGTPVGYQVRIFELAAAGTYTNSFDRDALLTRATSIVLPPGLLTSGSDYAVAVEAIASPGLDIDTRPIAIAWSLDVATASAVSGVWHAP
ncbi:MAG: hypothetical protein ACOZQL_15110 [Myxococcota bacterium]